MEKSEADYFEEYMKNKYHEHEVHLPKHKKAVPKPMKESEDDEDKEEKESQQKQP